jgi:hypothetical protein
MAKCEVEVGEDVGWERICVCERVYMYMVFPVDGLYMQLYRELYRDRLTCRRGLV